MNDRCRAGDFERTMLPHLETMRSVGRRRIRDLSLAEDVVQDARERAWNHHAAFRGGCTASRLLRIEGGAGVDPLPVASRRCFVVRAVHGASCEDVARRLCADSTISFPMPEPRLP